MEDKDRIERLFSILTELDSRDSCSNVILYQEKSWNELCDMGIELLNELKVDKKIVEFG